jgi:hypothetical protein
MVNSVSKAGKYTIWLLRSVMAAGHAENAVGTIELAYSRRQLNLVKSQNSQLVRKVGALYTLAETAGVWTGETTRDLAFGQLCL